jgi:hypothetical protein
MDNSLFNEVIAVHHENNIKIKEQCGSKVIIFNFQAHITLQTTVYETFHYVFYVFFMCCEI